MIVAACAVLVGITFGLMYSYSVFFKPLADYFGWDRASVSFIYSASMIVGGAISIGVGWLADRYGAARLMGFCGFMIGLGLILSSQVHNLWQLFLTYGLIEAVGIQSCFGIVAALASRWFIKNRGLAIAIITSGSGLGTFLIVPANGRLIHTFGLFETFTISGSVGGILMISLSFLLRPARGSFHPIGEKSNVASEINNKQMAAGPSLNLRQALKNQRFVLVSVIFFLFSFSSQIILVHLVNYATDTGINPLIAATFIGVIGLVGIPCQISVGAGSEKVGIYNILMLVRILLVIAFIWLILAKQYGSFTGWLHFSACL